MLSQAAIDLLEAMLLEKLIKIAETYELCDYCQEYDCLDDNCRGQWESYQAREYIDTDYTEQCVYCKRYGCLDDNCCDQAEYREREYIDTDYYDNDYSDEKLYGTHDEWEEYWDSIYN